MTQTQTTEAPAIKWTKGAYYESLEDGSVWTLEATFATGALHFRQYGSQAFRAVNERFANKDFRPASELPPILNTEADREAWFKDKRGAAVLADGILGKEPVVSIVVLDQTAVNLKRTAELWSVLFSVPVSMEMVASAMRLAKGDA